MVRKPDGSMDGALESAIRMKNRHHARGEAFPFLSLFPIIFVIHFECSPLSVKKPTHARPVTADTGLSGWGSGCLFRDIRMIREKDIRFPVLQDI